MLNSMEQNTPPQEATHEPNWFFRHILLTCISFLVILYLSIALSSYISVHKPSTSIPVVGSEGYSPAYSTDGDMPIGATCKCKDGTYSFSPNVRIACSHRGGIVQWL